MSDELKIEQELTDIYLIFHLKERVSFSSNVSPDQIHCWLYYHNLSTLSSNLKSLFGQNSCFTSIMLMIAIDLTSVFYTFIVFYFVLLL